VTKSSIRTESKGETERELFNKFIACGDLECHEPGMDHAVFKPDGCGARDWRVFRPNVWPSWARKLICQNCGRHTDIVWIQDRDKVAQHQYEHPTTPTDCLRETLR